MEGCNRQPKNCEADFTEEMRFVFRGSRGDVESGFPVFIPERGAARLRAGGRPVNSNTLVFLITVLLLFMVINSNQMSPNFLLWLVLSVFLMATSLRMYATCQQLQAQAQAQAAGSSGLLGHTELRLHMPHSRALETRGRLQGLRLQLSLLNREFDSLDYDTLRSLDSDNAPDAPSLSEEEINALPVHIHQVQLNHGSSTMQSNGQTLQQESSSTQYTERKQVLPKFGGSEKCFEELTCSVCLEQVVVGELVRSLPCLHQYHTSCIDPWLRQQGTCPVCKFKVSSGWRESSDSDPDSSSYML